MLTDILTKLRLRLRLNLQMLRLRLLHYRLRLLRLLNLQMLRLRLLHQCHHDDDGHHVRTRTADLTLLLS
jgi:hypothetical protein